MGELRIDHPADDVCRLTIVNPDKRNALDHEILDAITRELPGLDSRCLLITAEGPVFSAGYDIGNLARRPLDGALSQADVFFVPESSPARREHVYAAPDQRAAQTAEFAAAIRRRIDRAG